MLSNADPNSSGIEMGSASNKQGRFAGKILNGAYAGGNAFSSGDTTIDFANLTNAEKTQSSASIRKSNPNFKLYSNAPSLKNQASINFAKQLNNTSPLQIKGVNLTSS